LRTVSQTMANINELTKTLAIETKVQGQKLTRVEQNMQETKTNMEAGNEQLDIKIKRDS
jgi:t-SNARE complex subunit (syntaxin)